MSFNKDLRFNRISFAVKHSSFFERFFDLKEVKTRKDREVFTNIWYNIWIEEGYAEPGEYILEKKRKYERFSKDYILKFLLIPMGTIRIIHNNSEVGLPTITDFETHKNLNDQKLVELSLFSIKKGYRFFHLSNLVSLKKIYKLLKKDEILAFVAALDQRLFFFLKEKLSMPLQKIAQEKNYEGSLTFPVFLSFKESEDYLKKRSFIFYNFFTR